MKILGKEYTKTEVISFIGAGLAIGLLRAIGGELWAWLRTLDYKAISDWTKIIGTFFSKTISVRIIDIIGAVILAVPFFRLFNRYIISKLFSEVIFVEDFTTNANFWALNYWGSRDPQKTNRIENGDMIFEAEPTDWTWRNLGQGGAFHDLRTGIIKGLTYEVQCKVKSKANTTMRFELWLHDTQERNSIHGEIETPPSDKFKIYSLKIKATKSRAIRIHLHCYAGTGQIIVDEVIVKRIR